ncbi:reverse transcriptase [Hirsutella rhossiliensis]
MGKVLSLVNFDVKGAYNGVFKDRLLQRLAARVCPELVRWVDAFCSERTASITSSHKQVFPGIAAFADSLLFFNADLVQTKISTSGGSIAFVDDYSAWSNRDGIQSIIDRALEWEKRSGATFEGDKTTIIHFTRMAERSSSSPFVIKGRTIWPQENAKVLGGLETAMQLKRLRGLSPRVARQLFTAAVAPAMDYASTEGYWLNRAQMVGAQAVTGAFRTVSTAHSAGGKSAHSSSGEVLDQRSYSPEGASSRPAGHQSVPKIHVPTANDGSRAWRVSRSKIGSHQRIRGGPVEDRIRVLCDLDDDQAAELVAKAQGIVVATSSSERRGVVGMGGCVRDTRVNNEQEALASYSITLGPREDQNPYVAELEAIATALRCMPARLEQRELVFVTSNRSAMQAIGQPRQQSGQYIIQEIYKHVRLFRQRGVSIRMIWAPAGAEGKGSSAESDTRGAHPGELAISSPLDKTGNLSFFLGGKSMSDGDKWKPNLPAYWQTRDAEHLEKWAFKQACQRRNWRLKCTDRSKMWGFWVLQSKVEDLATLLFRCWPISSALFVKREKENIMRDQGTDQPQTLDCIKRRLVHSGSCVESTRVNGNLAPGLRRDALSVMHMRVSTIQALPSDSHNSLPRISFVAKVSDLLRKHDSCYRLSDSHMSIPGKRFVYVGAGDPRPKISKVCLGSICGLLKSGVQLSSYRLSAADEEKNKMTEDETRLDAFATTSPRANDRSIVSPTIDVSPTLTNAALPPSVISILATPAEATAQESTLMLIFKPNRRFGLKSASPICLQAVGFPTPNDYAAPVVKWFGPHSHCLVQTAANGNPGLKLVLQTILEDSPRLIVWATPSSDLTWGTHPATDYLPTPLGLPVDCVEWILTLG